MPHSQLSRIDVSVVVPVYKSTKSLIELVSRIRSALSHSGLTYEVILVDDSGVGESWSSITDLAESNTEVKGVRLSRNFGQHAATLCGISATSGEVIVTIDDDLEHPPEYIPSLVGLVSAGSPVAYVKFSSRSHSIWRNATSEFARAVLGRAIPNLPRNYSSFRAIHRTVAARLRDFNSPNPFIDGYLAWLASGFKELEMPHGERVSGTSNYSLRKLLTHTVNIFLNFSDLPLRATSTLGFLMSGFGLAWLIAVALLYFSGGITEPGYSSLIGAILFLGGVQLGILGIFGRYLRQINTRTAKMPVWVVAQETKV